MSDRLLVAGLWPFAMVAICAVPLSLRIALRAVGARHTEDSAGVEYANLSILIRIRQYMKLRLCENAQRVAMAVLPLFLYITFCTMASISRMILNALNDCLVFYTDEARTASIQFLRMDVSVVCDSDWHKSIRRIAWALLAVWPVGCPLLYLSLLVACRNSIRSGQKTKLSQATRFLWAEYESRFYWCARILSQCLQLGSASNWQPALRS